MHVDSVIAKTTLVSDRKKPVQGTLVCQENRVQHDHGVPARMCLIGIYGSGTAGDGTVTKKVPYRQLVKL